jgi:hypothetical protein
MAAETKPTPAKWNHDLKGQLRNHWVGILGGFVLGILLTIISFQIGKRERQPLFAATARSVIVKQHELPKAPLKITKLDGTETKSDIVYAEFYFWNAGREPIWSNDVLRTVRLRVQGGSILSQQVTRSSRPDITKVELIPDSAGVTLRFNVLELRDGLKGSFVYEGPADAPIICDGAVLGAGVRVLEVAEEETRRTPTEARTMWAFIAIVIVGLALHGGREASKLDKARFWPAFRKVTAIMVAILLGFWLFLIVMRATTTSLRIPYELVTTVTN